MLVIGNCSICHENVKMAEFGILRNCPHGFHRKCIEHWLRQNNSCPLCRKVACVRDIIKPIIDPPVIPGNVDQLTITLKFDSIELKKNKMNLSDRASKLGFARNELEVTSNDDIDGRWRCVRAILPVQKFNQSAKEKYIAFYFEGHIKKTLYSNVSGVGMGFCSSQFPLEGNYIGKQQNSIGFMSKQGMYNCGGWTHFQNGHEPFKVDDMIGLGLIYEPENASIKCFAICNRKLLGSAELPAKFFDVPIFPVVGLYDKGNSIKLNFGQKDWDFDPRQIIHLIQ